MFGCCGSTAPLNIFAGLNFPINALLRARVDPDVFGTAGPMVKNKVQRVAV